MTALVLDEPIVQDIYLVQGQTWNWPIELYETDGITPIDISDAIAAHLQARCTKNAPTAFIDISLGNGITIATNTITYTRSEAFTDALTTFEGVYDLFVTFNTGRIKLFKGNVFVERRSTELP